MANFKPTKKKIIYSATIALLWYLPIFLVKYFMDCSCSLSFEKCVDYEYLSPMVSPGCHCGCTNLLSVFFLYIYGLIGPFIITYCVMSKSDVASSPITTTSSDNQKCAYDASISKNKTKENIILIILSVFIISTIFTVVNLKSSTNIRLHGEGIIPLGFIRAEPRSICDDMCQRYIDSDFSQEEALKYCEKYFEIDFNSNENLSGEAVELNAYGVCEDRVYCFNIKECSWGSSRRSRLTPKNCKDLMCYVYTEINGGDNETAASIIQEKILFGSCDIEDPEISFEYSNGAVSTLATWWTSTYQNVHCPGKTG